MLLEMNIFLSQRNPEILFTKIISKYNKLNLKKETMQVKSCTLYNLNLLTTYNKICKLVNQKIKINKFVVLKQIKTILLIVVCMKLHKFELI